METKDIIANNVLIAEFMGLLINDFCVFIPNEYKHCNEHIRRLPLENGFYEGDISDLGYHYDFNLLLSVLEQIEKMGFDTSIHYSLDRGGNLCYIHDSPIQSLNAVTKIEAVYNAVLEFIKWHNLNK